MLDLALDVVEPVLYGQHVADGGCLLQNCQQLAASGVQCREPSLDVGVLAGDVLAVGGARAHVAERAHPSEEVVEGRRRDAHGHRARRIVSPLRSAGIGHVPAQSIGEAGETAHRRTDGPSANLDLHRPGLDDLG